MVACRRKPGNNQSLKRDLPSLFWLKSLRGKMAEAMGGERREAEKTIPQDILQTSSHLLGILGFMRNAGREGTWVLFLSVLVSYVAQKGMDILV